MATRDGLTIKAMGIAALIALAEFLFDGGGVGASIGLFALGWIVTLIVTRRAVTRVASARIAAIAAVGFALVLIDDPNIFALMFFGIAVNLAALLPRHRFDDAISWAGRLIWQGLSGLTAPLRDLAATAERRPPMHGVAATLVVPVVGAMLFIALFASANPLIDRAFGQLDWPDWGTMVWRTILAVVVLVLGWATLRPRASVTRIEGRQWDGGGGALTPNPAALFLSLATFNAIFAVQNMLDIAFLWSGAPLPDGVTMADYAHRGAYALIVTALLAGAFVIVAYRPGGARSRTIRWLTGIWIAQNLLLVASSALRTIDYVDAYGMTVLRLAALAWMALVATGLILIFWRIAGGKSARWLINANALAAAIVLRLSSAIDYAATAATWNARVALAQGKAGPPLDLCYMRRLGPSALVSLATLERHARSPVLRDRLAAIRWDVQRKTAIGQRRWRSWSYRDARRLTRVEAMVGTRAPHLLPAPNGRSCGGERLTSVQKR